ncbi:MAG: CotH kinase family protein [Chloroflexota bacterium]
MRYLPETVLSPTKLSSLLRKLVLFLILSVFLGIGLTVSPAQAEEINVFPTIRFSQDSVAIEAPFQLSLTQLVAGTIRYTTDGALPTPHSLTYTAPIEIAKSTVVRAQIFDALGAPMGKVYTKSYLVIDFEQTIPIISITADQSDLNALHANANKRGREWERPMNMEYILPGGQVAFNVPAGIRIHGGKSRLFSPKKSYRIYFRKSYDGPGKLNYPLFADTDVTKFDKLVLRAGYNDAFTYLDEGNVPTVQSYNATYIGDQVVRNLHQNLGQPIAHGRWVLLYLNGEFWGLYNMTERLDLQHFQSYSEKNADWDVIEKKAGWNEFGEWESHEEAREGDYGAWHENQEWVGTTDFSNPGNIGILEWRVNMENLFSYLFLQAYVQNYDWPRSNWLVYRRKDVGGQAPEGQWRMMVWDAEYSFGGGSKGFKTDMNTTVKIHSPHDSITRILEKPFIHNCALKHRFVNRAREYLGVENIHNKPLDQVGQLSKAKVRAEIIRQKNIVRPYIQMEIDRWVPNTEGISLARFDDNIANTLRFVDEREDVILHHLDELRYQTFTMCQ